MKSFIFGMLAIPLALIAAGTVKAAANLEKATFAGGGDPHPQGKEYSTVTFYVA